MERIIWIKSNIGLTLTTASYSAMLQRLHETKRSHLTFSTNVSSASLNNQGKDNFKSLNKVKWNTSSLGVSPSNGSHQPAPIIENIENKG